MLGFRAVGFAGGVLSTLHFLGGCRRIGQMFKTCWSVRKAEDGLATGLGDNRL